MSEKSAIWTAMNEKCFIVTMYRYGNREGHSYILGVFSNEALARLAGNDEISHRGGKYYPEILLFQIDTPKKHRTVMELEVDDI